MSLTLRSYAIVLGVAGVYGVICRLLFASPQLSDWLQIVSIAFIYTMPLSLGALVCFLGFKLDRPSRFWSMGAPMLTMGILLLGSLFFNLEALLCVVVAAPVALGFALLGGFLMGLFLKRGDPGRLSVTFVVLLPFAVAPVEQLWQLPHETRVMRNAVAVRASPEIVWSHIFEVAPIQAAELPEQWIYTLGFPRPIAAMIDRQGVGGVRHATFERDVSFFEVVTHWEPLQRLAFTIKADPAFIPQSAFDEHIIVGGRFYDVLDGTYEIEARADGTCILHLESTHRLSTRFNVYTGWWSEWVMDQIQGSILEVIRKRCEVATSRVVS